MRQHLASEMLPVFSGRRIIIMISNPLFFFASVPDNSFFKERLFQVEPFSSLLKKPFNGATELSRCHLRDKYFRVVLRTWKY